MRAWLSEAHVMLEPEAPAMVVGRIILLSVSAGRLRLFISPAALSVVVSLCTATVNVLCFEKPPRFAFAVRITSALPSGGVTVYVPEGAFVTLIMPVLSDDHVRSSPERVIVFPVPTMSVGLTSALFTVSLTHCSSGFIAGAVVPHPDHPPVPPVPPDPPPEPVLPPAPLEQAVNISAMSSTKTAPKKANALFLFVLNFVIYNS